MHDPIEPLLTPEDVAQHLRVSEETLTTWRCTGRQQIPFVKVGRLVRYGPSDVDAYLNSRPGSLLISSRLASPSNEADDEPVHADQR